MPYASHEPSEPFPMCVTRLLSWAAFRFGRCRARNAAFGRGENMVTRKGPWRRYGMAASLAAFCCVALMSGAASAQVKFRRIGTVTTTINGQLCTNNGNDMVCDSTTPTISGGNVGIGSTTPGAKLTLTGTEALNLGTNALRMPHGAAHAVTIHKGFFGA
jgi:hypothetical protein